MIDMTSQKQFPIMVVVTSTWDQASRTTLPSHYEFVHPNIALESALAAIAILQDWRDHEDVPTARRQSVCSAMGTPARISLRALPWWKVAAGFAEYVKIRSIDITSMSIDQDSRGRHNENT